MIGMGSGSEILRAEQVKSGYGNVSVLHGVDLTVRSGQIVALVGSNGAGKSTLLRAISGLNKVSSGRIVFDGIDITDNSPESTAYLGLQHVAEGRRLFRGLSVADNLALGFYGLRLSAVQERERLDDMRELFPILFDRLSLKAGGLSGGQQQMLAIAQALVRRPKLLLLDEPSLGLAPIIVAQVFDVLDQLRRRGTAIVLVEQVVDQALALADFGHVMRGGRILASGVADELLESDSLRSAYFGMPSDRET
jgi:branched-chain amino acid transport system ATP-binding protein